MNTAKVIGGHLDGKELDLDKLMLKKQPSGHVIFPNLRLQVWMEAVPSLGIPAGWEFGRSIYEWRGDELHHVEDVGELTEAAKQWIADNEMPIEPEADTPTCVTTAEFSSS